MKAKRYYVTMTDQFMSGWGLAKGKINKYVVECYTYAQAEAIERAAHERSEMRRVALCIHPPRYPAASHLVSRRLVSELPYWLDAGQYNPSALDY